jgi:mannose-6-phosphate isomerase-like protein (cupin superfamily)
MRRFMVSRNWRSIMNMLSSATTVTVLVTFVAAPALATDYHPPFEPIVAVGGQTRLIYPEGPVELLVTEAETNGQFGMVVVYTKPNEGPGDNFFLEYKLTETYYVLAGRYHFSVGDDTYEGGPGTIVVSPPNMPHGYRNIGSDVGKLLILYAPADGTRGTGFFVRWADMATRSPAWIAKTHAAYGIDRSAE